MNLTEDPGLETSFRVRVLEEGDLEAIVRLDALYTGRPRPEYYRKKVEAALRHTGVRVSLVAEEEGFLVGFIMGSVYYGEFGRSEPTAMLDSLAVHPDQARRGVGRALLEQFCKNLKALGVERVETLVRWDNWPLVAFLSAEGFRPGHRFCLERRLTP